MHAIVGTLLDTKFDNTAPQQNVFEAQYKAQDPIISDHRIFGIAIVPGSFHLARLFAVLVNYYKIDCFEIPEVTFMNPLVIPETETKSVFLEITSESNSKYQFKVSSARATHMVGSVIGHSTTAPALNPNILERCTNELAMSRFDRYFTNCHLTYGHGYKWIEKALYNESESFNYMRAAQPSTETQGLLLHPGQIDCSFQAFISIIFAIAETSVAADAWVLGGIKSIKVYAKPQGKLKCHNVLTDAKNFNADTRKTSGDIAIYDEQNTHVADFFGVLVAKASADKIKALLAL